MTRSAARLLRMLGLSCGSQTEDVSLPWHFPDGLLQVVVQEGFDCQEHWAEEGANENCIAPRERKSIVGQVGKEAHGLQLHTTPDVGPRMSQVRRLEAMLHRFWTKCSLSQSPIKQ